MVGSSINIITILVTLALLYSEKIPSYLIIIGGICLGYVV
jgi:hypothetical protein